MRTCPSEEERHQGYETVKSSDHGSSLWLVVLLSSVAAFMVLYANPGSTDLAIMAGCLCVLGLFAISMFKDEE